MVDEFSTEVRTSGFYLKKAALSYPSIDASDIFLKVFLESSVFSCIDFLWAEPGIAKGWAVRSG